MSVKTLNLELGALHNPADVCHLFGVSAEVLRDMCRTGEVTCDTRITSKGAIRYRLSDQDIRAWRQKGRN